ncbi:MAG: hypothetical protein LLG15_11865 [Betaproteobacteria bacterium]|nr:hypothetical protein [Betaproteobacteria bacterium]
MNAAPAQIAASDASNGKGGVTEVNAARIQDFAMLKIAERPTDGKAKTAPAQKFYTVSDTRRAALWLDEMVATRSVNTVVADLTPDIAAVLLERNPSNRKIKPHKVEDYSHDIKGGAWKFNGEPIIIARDGLLNDGQHRCAAVLEARIPIKAVFVFGVERDTRDTLDQGANRTAGDYLGIHGHQFTNHLAAVAKAVWQWRTYGFVRGRGSKFSPTRSEILLTVEKNPGIVKSFDFVNRKNSQTMGSASPLAFAHFAIKSVAGDLAANYFMDALIDGTNLKSSDPILVARNRLIMGRKNLLLAEKAELLFKAWNAHRLDRTGVNFRLTGGELPLLEA